MSLHSHMKCVARINGIVRKQHVVDVAFCKLKLCQTQQLRMLFTPTTFCPTENEFVMHTFPNYVQQFKREYSQKKLHDSSTVIEKEVVSETVSNVPSETKSSTTTDSDTAVNYTEYNRSTQNDVKQPDYPTFQRQSKAGELLRTSRRGGVSVTRRLGMMLPDDFWKSPEEAEKYLHPSDTEPDDISTDLESPKHQRQRGHPAPLRSLNPVDRLNNMLQNEVVVSDVHDKFGTTSWENAKRNCDEEATKVDHNQMSLKVGELALMNFFANRRVFQRLIILNEERVYESKRHGNVAHNDIIGQYEDSRLESTAGYTVLVKRPTLEDYAAVMRKIVTTPDVKVLSTAISHVGISRGDAILEAGTGQGVSALVFSQTVGKEGLVHSVEKTAENYVKAQKNFHRWADSYDKSHVTNPWPRNVTFYHSSLADFQSQIQYDMVFLDLPSPVASIDTALSLVKPGKCILMYTPSPTRIVSFLKEAGTRRLPLVLEGVWEEGRKLWHVRTKGFEHDHLVPLSLTEGWSIDYPTVIEQETAFIAKFRKIVPLAERGNVSRHFTGVIEKDSISHALAQWWSSVGKQTSAPDGNVRLLKENDFVAIRAILQPKKRDRVQLAGNLTPGGVYTNDWGAILHNSLIGQSEGKIMRMMSGFLMYPFCVTLEEFLALSGSFRYLRVRTVRLLQRLADVRTGDKLLVVGDPLTVATMALLLSQAVWDGGQVEVVSWDRKQWPGKPVQKVAKWKAIYHKRTDQHWPDNIHIHSECESLPSDVTTASFDGVIVCVTSHSATFCLNELMTVLKPKRYVTVLVETVTQVNDVLEFTHSHNTEVQLVDVTEDKERRWHVRPVDESAGSFEPDYNEAFVCRPKPRKFAKLRNTMFLVRLRKI